MEAFDDLQALSYRSRRATDPFSCAPASQFRQLGAPPAQRTLRAHPCCPVHCTLLWLPLSLPVPGVDVGEGAAGRTGCHASGSERSQRCPTGCLSSPVRRVRKPIRHPRRPAAGRLRRGRHADDPLRDEHVQLVPHLHQAVILVRLTAEVAAFERCRAALNREPAWRARSGPGFLGVAVASGGAGVGRSAKRADRTARLISLPILSGTLTYGPTNRKILD